VNPPALAFGDVDHDLVGREHLGPRLEIELLDRNGRDRLK
jgi:hypothetical protein